MTKNAQKGWKPLVFKIAIIAMSICYVFGSSHHEINKILHVLTHQLEMPDNVIGHSSAIHIDHKAHKNHPLNTAEEVHNHKLLKILNKVLKVLDNETNPENSNIISFKIDKHITRKELYQNKQPFLLKTIQHKFLFKRKKILEGFSRDVLQPPQLS